VTPEDAALQELIEAAREYTRFYVNQFSPSSVVSRLPDGGLRLRARANVRLTRAVIAYNKLTGGDDFGPEVDTRLVTLLEKIERLGQA
jgi:hypothetical protein